MTINAFAREMATDRTTLGRNIMPLEREGLVEIVPGASDRRSKELRLNEAGATVGTDICRCEFNCPGGPAGCGIAPRSMLSRVSAGSEAICRKF